MTHGPNSDAILETFAGYSDAQLEWALADVVIYTELVPETVAVPIKTAPYPWDNKTVAPGWDDPFGVFTP